MIILIDCEREEDVEITNTGGINPENVIRTTCSNPRAAILMLCELLTPEELGELKLTTIPSIQARLRLKREKSEVSGDIDHE